MFKKSNKKIIMKNVQKYYFNMLYQIYIFQNMFYSETARVVFQIWGWHL